jgi:midasin
MRRCLRHEEPVLLVGETGTGKTSVCQLLALMRHTHLHVLNCNQHTETSDFLGGFRPTRTRTRDLAHLRAVAQGLLQSPAWQLCGQQPPQELAAAAAAAASPVEVEALLTGLTAELKELQVSLQAALQQQQTQLEGTHGDETDPAAAEAAASDAQARVNEVQQLLQELSEGGSALKAAAAAARAPFGWEDGPLVVAMRAGQLLLVDELNLAEDAVLERLNRWWGGCRGMLRVCVCVCGVLVLVLFDLCWLVREPCLCLWLLLVFLWCAWWGGAAAAAVACATAFFAC